MSELKEVEGFTVAVPNDEHAALPAPRGLRYHATAWILDAETEQYENWLLYVVDGSGEDVEYSELDSVNVFASGLVDVTEEQAQALDGAGLLLTMLSPVLGAMVGKIAGKTAGRVSGRNPPISPRQKAHIDGTAGKSQFKPGIDADSVTRTAWEQGVPVFDKNGKFLGKRFTFENPIGTSPSGFDQSSIFVHWSPNNGIHGVPTTTGTR